MATILEERHRRRLDSMRFAYPKHAQTSAHQIENHSAKVEFGFVAIALETANPDKGLKFHEFVLAAKSERREFDFLSPHQYNQGGWSAFIPKIQILTVDREFFPFPLFPEL